MTQDELFDAARKSHLDVYALGRDKALFIYRLEAFAQMIEDAAFQGWVAHTRRVVLAEREACARVCEDLDAHRQVATWYSQAIRARGEA